MEKYTVKAVDQNMRFLGGPGDVTSNRHCERGHTTGTRHTHDPVACRETERRSREISPHCMKDKGILATQAGQ